MSVACFKQLTVWQRAMQLAKAVYRESSKLPAVERYALCDQMRRAAVSVPSNIAEGSKRGTTKDFIQFLRIADGSAAELETQLLLAVDMYGMVFDESFVLLTEVQKMLSSLIRSLATSH